MSILLTFALSHQLNNTFTQGLVFFSRMSLLYFFGIFIAAKSPAAQAQIMMMSWIFCKICFLFFNMIKL